MRSKATNVFLVCKSNLCVLALLCLCLLSKHRVSADADAANRLRKGEDLANITFVANDINCSTKCVVSIATGDRKGCQGSSGDDCSFPFEVCPDDETQCFGPMASCKYNPGSSPNFKYHCDCKLPFSMEKMSVMEDELIQDCLERTTKVCEKDQIISLYAFCTNGGECVKEIDSGEPHPGCFCPGRFVGRHCEKRRGTGAEYRFEREPVQIDAFNEVPVQEIFNKVPVQKLEHYGLPVWAYILIVVFSAALVCFLVYVVILYRRFLARHDEASTEDGNSKEEMNIHISPNGNDSISGLEFN
mmetsp:Transcript_104/g.275  ORF Transcript_104/g.275 Transcript_104/m.275 type:complete len:301 (+) Transcript_104:211-1113(+)